MKTLPGLLVIGLACSPDTRHSYRPEVREVTLTTVPLVTRELQRTYRFLNRDFAKGGVLEGKEVYGFMPSTLVAYQGDTLRITIVNPEDDAHTFVLGKLFLSIPGQSERTATYVASEVGVFTFLCNLPTHAPFMYGQLVVLPGTDAGPS